MRNQKRSIKYNIGINCFFDSINFVHVCVWVADLQYFVHDSKQCTQQNSVTSIYFVFFLFVSLEIFIPPSILTRNLEKYAFVYCSIQNTIYLILLHFILFFPIPYTIPSSASLQEKLTIVIFNTTNKIVSLYENQKKCSDYRFDFFFRAFIGLLVNTMCRNANQTRKGINTKRPQNVSSDKCMKWLCVKSLLISNTNYNVNWLFAQNQYTQIHSTK